jgi:hypothetical protein
MTAPSPVPDPLHALIENRLRVPAPAATPFVGRLLEEGNRAALGAIVFYGSRLSELPGASGSIFDFYLVVDSYADFHRQRRDRALGRVLPPSVYVRSWELPDGARLRCKYCVISAADLRRATSARAHDVHNLGRFSKRVALAWARDEAAAGLIAEAQVGALRALAPHALALLPERFRLDDFVRAGLALSYLGERRVSEDAKVEALYEVEREHYRALYRRLLVELQGVQPARRLLAGATEDEYSKAPVQARERGRTKRLLARSRRRGKLRWPKYLLTFGDTWLDYLIEKVERNYGVRVELSERERRWPLLFAWGKYFALKRKGVVK